MSATDAPDWQRVVTTVTAAGDVPDAPDWQRIVVGPGGKPVGGGGLAHEYVGVSDGTEVPSPGSATLLYHSPAADGGYLVFAVFAPTFASVGGTYQVGCGLALSGPGSMLPYQMSAFPIISLGTQEFNSTGYIPLVGVLLGAVAGSTLLSMNFTNYSGNPGGLSFYSATPVTPSTGLLLLRPVT